MTRWADLHIHTYYSDSTQSPTEVVEQAKSVGLSCIAVTDHDVIDGFEPLVAAALGRDLEVIAGIELSSEMDGQDIHILGYFLDVQNPELIAKLKEMQDARVERIAKMIAKLNELGIRDITLEETMALTKSRAVGRLHLAMMLHQKGHVSSIKEAFDRFIGEGKRAYFTKYYMTPFEAIDLIRKSGGIAVMAHPTLTQRDELIRKFALAGMGGLEVYYPNCSNAIIEFYKRLAKKYNLALTGGSDAHGAAKVHTYIGKVMIPYELVECLRARRDELQTA